MKKLGSLALAALLVAALSVSASAASTSSAAQGTATIDGKKDDIYACDPLTVATDEAGGAAQGATGKVWTAWDASNLYVYVEVTDAAVTKAEDVTTTYTNDSVEVYINISGEEGAIADIDAGQITYGPSFESIQGVGLYRENNIDNIKTAYTYTDTGYTVEMALPFADFGAKVGATLGFSIGINDDTDDDSSTREFHTFDGEGLGSAWSTADSNWGTLTLTDTVYTAPAADDDNSGSAATADAGIIAAVASLAASGAAVLSLKKRK